ncbi:MAG: glycosyltransferase family 39 protein [Tannerella sp.]|nr:glycosyltransferase family 39 protein [Tannerella sp.]
MRTTALQYLYLQKPVSSMLLVALLSVLPWIAAGDFATKGEPREAAVAVSMLESGNWMLPRVYADEFAYKPPMTHWLMALFSLPQGHVSPFTARLPSALAYAALLAVSLLFFGRKVRFQEAFIATLLLFTCVEIHRAGMTARVDMLLTFFTVAGLIRLFRWEEEGELKGLPLLIPLLLSGAFLTKGPVGLVLPVFVFGVYLLLLRKYRLFKIAKSLFYIGVASLFLPSLWYIEAWRMGGEDFLNVALAENFGRFLHLNPGNIHYELGHENGAWYNLVTLAAGFLPWTLLLFISLFGLKISRPGVPLKEWPARLWRRIGTMDRITLFCLTASVCIVFFYSLPSSKRSVYLMPAYPFIALFIARYLLYLAEYRSRVTRLYAGVLASLVAVAALVVAVQMTGLADVRSLAGQYVAGAFASATLDAVARSFSPGISMILTGTLLLVSLATVVYQMRKKINIKILYATFFLVFSTHLFIDGVVMINVRRAGSARPFATEIRQAYGLDHTNVYVMNDLHTYHNMYGLNFYLGNRFRNFATEQPQTGFFLVAEKDLPAVEQRYGEVYDFRRLRVSDGMTGDVRGRIVLSRFTRK